VILGTRLKDGEKTWKECALAKTLIDEESLSSTNLVSKNFAIGKVNVPTQFGFGVERAEEEMLFNALPVLTSDMALRGTLDEELYDADLENQQIKAQMFAKILDLRNANAGGIAAVNRLRIIYAFSTPERPFNTGRTEVQGTQPDQSHQILPFAQFRYYSRSFDLQNSKCMEASHNLQR
jgi:small subunit ribosomal protein S15